MPASRRSVVTRSSVRSTSPVDEPIRGAAANNRRYEWRAAACMDCPTGSIADRGSERIRFDRNRIVRRDLLYHDRDVTVEMQKRGGTGTNHSGGADLHAIAGVLRRVAAQLDHYVL